MPCYLVSRYGDAPLSLVRQYIEQQRVPNEFTTVTAISSERQILRHYAQFLSRRQRIATERPLSDKGDRHAYSQFGNIESRA